MTHRTWARTLGVWAVTGTILAASGCATHTRTVARREHTEQTTSTTTGATPASEHVVVEHDTTTVHEHPAEPQGILSTTVHVIGEILALPFRLVGGLLRMIF